MLSRDLTQLPKIRRAVRQKKQTLARLKNSEHALNPRGLKEKELKLKREINKLVLQGNDLVRKGRSEYRRIQTSLETTLTHYRRAEVSSKNLNRKTEQKKENLESHESVIKRLDERRSELKKRLRELKFQREVAAICLLDDSTYDDEIGIMAARRRTWRRAAVIVLLCLAVLAVGTAVLDQNWGSVAGEQLEKTLQLDINQNLLPLSFSYARLTVHPLLARVTIKHLDLSSELFPGLTVQCEKAVLRLSPLDLLPMIFNKPIKNLNSAAVMLQNLRGRSGDLTWRMDTFFMRVRGDLNKELFAQILTEIALNTSALRVKVNISGLEIDPGQLLQDFSADSPLNPSHISQLTTFKHISITAGHDPQARSLSIDHLRLKTPVVELLFSGELLYRADGTFDEPFPAESLSARAWIELKPGGTDSVFNSELVSVGLESATLAVAVDLLYPRDQKSSPRLQKGQAGLQISGLSAELPSMAEEGLKVDLQQLTADISYQNGLLQVMNTKINSSLFQAGLRMSIDLDQDDPGSARIKEGRLVLSDLAAGGIELIKEFGLVSAPPETGGALEIELKGPLFDPEIVVVPIQ